LVSKSDVLFSLNGFGEIVEEQKKNSGYYLSGEQIDERLHSIVRCLTRFCF
jgi:hypothetical protein